MNRYPPQLLKFSFFLNENEKGEAVSKRFLRLPRFGFLKIGAGICGLGI